MSEIFKQCDGNYIFWLEGDDFWVSREKVDLQIDALELNPDLNLCFTSAFIVSGENYQPTEVMARRAAVNTIFSLDQVIRGDGSFMPSPSLCFRRNFFNIAPEWLFGSVPIFDYPLQVLTSSPRGALYLPNITCAYRTNIEGSWTTRLMGDPKSRMLFEADFITLLLQLHRTLPGNRDSIVHLAYNHCIALLGISIQLNDYTSFERALLSLKEIR